MRADINFGIFDVLLTYPPKPSKNLARNRAERKENARWAFLAKEPGRRKGLI